MPAWRRLLARVLAICEEKGNYVVTIGSLASLTSIMMANMAYFRMLQLVSGSLYFTYNMTRRPPLMSAAYWNLVFFTINVLMLLRLFFETRPETFSENGKLLFHSLLFLQPIHFDSLHFDALQSLTSLSVIFLILDFRRVNLNVSSRQPLGGTLPEVKFS